MYGFGFALTRMGGAWEEQLAKNPVGVEKVTSISGMRLGRSMLEESIRTCFV
jgi:hypothetical protein